MWRGSCRLTSGHVPPISGELSVTWTSQTQVSCNSPPFFKAHFLFLGVSSGGENLASSSPGWCHHPYLCVPKQARLPEDTARWGRGWPCPPGCPSTCPPSVRAGPRRCSRGRRGAFQLKPTPLSSVLLPVPSGPVLGVFRRRTSAEAASGPPGPRLWEFLSAHAPSILGPSTPCLSAAPPA